MKKSRVYEVICLIAIIVITIRPLLSIYHYKDTFFARGYSRQYEALKSAYYSSQYIKKKNPGIIPDETFEAFVAGAFLRGVNPILINHDQPPLGRYILALSIFLFDNVNTIMIVLHVLSLIGVFLIARLVLRNILMSLIPLGIFINEPLFLNKFVYSPLLEPVQLPFIIFTLFFFIKGVTQKNYRRWFVLTSVLLGFVISIRFFTLGLFLLISMFCYFLFNKRFGSKPIAFALTLPLSLLVLFLSYMKTIQAGYSLPQILGVQKYIYFYHKSQLILPFSFWDLIMFNRWHTWWGERAISSDNQWIIIWPISMILTIISICLYVFRKIFFSDAEKVIIIWIIVYSLFLSLGTVSTRYFSPLLPFLYIAATSFLVRLLKMQNKKVK